MRPPGPLVSDPRTSAFQPSIAPSRVGMLLARDPLVLRLAALPRHRLD